ncbi:MAG TPA: HDIG domain-containing protein, partial [Desulfatiglandales bacterium]|nr:HDIG domain-containing protein [Desulfatiglandales bacterium]
ITVINDALLRLWSLRSGIRPWIILTVLSLVISIFLFPEILIRPKVYKIGDVAEGDIKASSDILVENTALTMKDREDAIKAVPNIYDFDPSASNLEVRLKEAMFDVLTSIAVDAAILGAPMSGERIASLSTYDREAIRERFFLKLEIPDNEALFDRIIRSGFPKELEDSAIELTNAVFQRGVVGNMMVLINQSQKGILLQSILNQEETPVTDLTRFYDIEGARKAITGQKEELIKKGVPSGTALIAIQLAQALVKPNVTFNQRDTELRKSRARASVKPVYYQIKKGEMLVREGERIGEEHLVKLSAEARMKGQRSVFGRVPGMTILIGLLFLFVYMTGLMKPGVSSYDIRYRVFNSLTLLLIFIFVWLYGFIAEDISRGFRSFTSEALLFAMPVACGSMLISVFEGMSMATMFSLLLAVLSSLVIDGDMKFFIYFLVSSLAAAYWVRDYRERGRLIKTGLKVGLINVLLCISMETVYGSLLSVETLVALTLGFIGGVLAGVIATGIIPLAEMIFDFTTDMKLLELANLDQPLLRELMVQAPGTYHHSVIVSSMVEATAKAIKANPLIAKVSAYYHDIGKMGKPLYFIENQAGGENRHDKLAPSMSNLILISHVKEGVELAQKHKLGREIIDIIQQHHGKSLISYFYSKAREQAVNRGGKNSHVKQEDFRYPGPKPQTKEAGLVMLADMAEAAVRSLANPSPARIQGTVQKIINKAFTDGQLDDCELTLKDLNEIATSFNKILGGIFHHRVEYPEVDSAGNTGVINGHTDQIHPEDTGGKKEVNREEDQEGLKRLGL